MNRKAFWLGLITYIAILGGGLALLGTYIYSKTLTLLEEMLTSIIFCLIMIIAMFSSLIVQDWIRGDGSGRS